MAWLPIGGWRQLSSLALGPIDQVIFSASNMLLILSISRSLDPSAFGRFSIGYSLYLGLQVLLRSSVGNPLLLRLGHSPQRAVTGSAFVLITLLAGMIPVLFVIGGFSKLGLGFVGAALASLVADVARYVSFGAGKPSAALLIDLPWIAVQLCSFILISNSSAEWGIAAWGLGSIVGLVMWIVSGPARIRRSDLRVVDALVYLRSSARGVAGPFLAEAAVVLTVSQLLIWIPLALFEPETVGGIRGIQTLFTPSFTVAAGIRLAALPKLRGRPTIQIARLAAVAGSFAFLLAVCNLVVWSLNPFGIGTWALGETWEVSRKMWVPASIAFSFWALDSVGPIFFLSINRVGAMARTKIIVACSQMGGLAVAGIFASTPSQMVVGLAVGSGLGSAIWIGSVYRYCRSLSAAELALPSA